jgi:hypothetical protein
MKTSCLRHPESSIYLQLHSWMFKLCQDNQCAALLLAYFSGWHDWKLEHDQYYKRFNDIAETHGDGRPHIENAYLFFTNEELIAGIMGLYGKKAINEALDFLVSLGVISIHNNPNPRYHFDKTKYFRFYADVCNAWIAENYPVSNHHKIKSQPIDSTDRVKLPYGKGEKDRVPAKNTRSAGESNRAITNTTNYITNKDQSITTSDHVDHFVKKETPSNHKWGEIQTIVDVLISIGMHPKRLDHPDVSKTLQDLYDAGATPSMFCDAYLKAVKTAPNGFGINYIAKIVQGLLDKLKSNQSLHRSLQKTTSPSKKCFIEDIPEKNWIQGK